MSKQENPSSVGQLIIGFNGLPELAYFNVMFNNNPDQINPNLGEKPNNYITRTYLKYVKLVSQLAELTPQDINLIQKANVKSAELGTSTNSAAKGGADKFISIIGDENKDKLGEFALEMAHPSSLVFNEALSDLVSRMFKGHYLAEQGKKLRDGASPKVDWAIHGHTKGLQPKAMIHFILSHFLERTITEALKSQDDEKIQELISHKDYFLNALSDVLRLQIARGIADPEIVEIWQNPREKGGLNWLKPERQEIFNSVIKKK